MMDARNAVMVLIDVQGKLAEVMSERDALFENLKRMILGAQALEVPILVTEQIPHKLGATNSALRELFHAWDPIAKSSFSCLGEPAFGERLGALGRNQVILTGIETHVCVNQTAMDLLALGREVYVVADAVSSRTAANRQLALERMRAAGASIVGAEMALFELLRDASDPRFKGILQLVK